MNCTKCGEPTEAQLNAQGHCAECYEESNAPTEPDTAPTPVKHILRREVISPYGTQSNRIITACGNEYSGRDIERGEIILVEQLGLTTCDYCREAEAELLPKSPPLHTAPSLREMLQKRIGAKNAKIDELLTLLERRKSRIEKIAICDSIMYHQKDVEIFEKILNFEGE